MTDTEVWAARPPLAVPLAKLRERLARLEESPGERKLYLGGFVFAVVGFAMVTLTTGLSAEAGSAVLLAGCVGLSLGLVKETYDWLLPRLNTGIGRLLGALLIATLGALIYDLADTAMNVATVAPSGTFVNSAERRAGGLSAYHPEGQ